MAIGRRQMAVLGLAALGAACAPGGIGGLVPQIRAPEVRLTGLELTGLGLQGQSFLATLDVMNPNSVPLPLDGLQLDLDLNGQRAAQASSATNAMIPAGGSGTVQLATTTSLIGVASQLMGLAQGQDVAYELSGSALIGGLFRVQLPYAETGRLRLVRSGTAVRLVRVDE